MYAIGTMFGVSEVFYTHIGRYYGNGLVFHNHWKNGAEIISLEEFSKGKSISVLDVGVDDVSGFYRRVEKKTPFARSIELSQVRYCRGTCTTSNPIKMRLSGAESRTFLSCAS